MTLGEYKTRQQARKRASQRAISYNPEWSPDYNKSERFRWVEHPSDGLRFVGKVDEIRMNGEGNQPYFDRSLVDHTGWYMNAFQDETAWGEVYQLPGRHGKPRYIPAICDSMNTHDKRGNDGAILDFHSITDDIRDAIRWADHMAEHYAEAEREYQAKEAAKCRCEEITGEIETIYADFKRLAAELRANCDKITGLPELKRLLHAEYRRVRSEVRSLRRERAKLEDNYWEAVPNW